MERKKKKKEKKKKQNKIEPLGVSERASEREKKGHNWWSNR
jgi:hypothetical protein